MESFGNGGQAFVFFAGFFDHAAGDEVLEFFVGAEAEHFFAPAGGVAGFEALVNDVEELFEFKGGAFGGEHCDKFFGNKVGEPPRKSAFLLHSHHRMESLAKGVGDFQQKVSREGRVGVLESELCLIAG